MQPSSMSLIESIRSYPPSVFFMLGNEFCERFSFYGMKAILVLYLVTEHQLSDSQASFAYHLFVSIAYLTPLIGSIAADNYFGRFRVILWVSIIYCIGHLLLSIGAIPGIDSIFIIDTITTGLDSIFRSFMDSSGLLVIAFATGGIKPCVSAFAADQFAPDQHTQRSQFFSFFYFAINAGALLAIFTTPILRSRVKCFGSDYCFPLAFGTFL
jgi:solute carrier family 15 oligopeptide transporter 1